MRPHGSSVRAELEAFPLHHVAFRVKADETREIVFVPPGLDVPNDLPIVRHQLVGIMG